MRRLYETLQRRARPEDVAEQILALLDRDSSARERRLLERAAAGSLQRNVWRYSSMLRDFARPVGLDVQIGKARIHFASAYALTAEEASDPTKVEEFLRVVSREIVKVFGQSDFEHDRLNREARRAGGLGEVSRRRYNRMFRHLARMERKLEKLIRERRKYDVLARLDDADKLALLDVWFGLLQEIAELLRETWQTSSIDRSGRRWFEPSRRYFRRVASQSPSGDR